MSEDTSNKPAVRVDFETWARTQQGIREWMLELCGGEYRDPSVESLWQGWHGHYLHAKARMLEALVPKGSEAVDSHLPSGEAFDVD